MNEQEVNETATEEQQEELVTGEESGTSNETEDEQDQEHEEPAEGGVKPKITANERVRQSLERTKVAEAKAAAAEAKAVELERQAAYFKGLAEGGRKPEPAPATPAKKPVAGDFETYDEYIDAAALYIEGKSAEIVSQKLQQEDERREAVRQQAKAQKVLDDAEAKYPDFKAVALRDGLPITETMARAADSGDRFADILYHLGKHPDEVERISRLSAIEQVKAIGRIEDKLTTAAAPPKPSQAPPPPTTLDGRGSSASTQNIYKMTAAEVAERRLADARKKG